MAAKLEVEVSVLDKISGQVAGINRTMTGFANNVEKSFGALTKGFVALAGIGGAAAGIMTVINRSIQLADQIKKTSDTIGLGTDSVQKWDYALRQNGSSIESAGKAFKNLAVKSYEAYTGNEKAAGSFKTLGVNLRDNNGVLKTNSQLSKESILALSDMENTTQRTAIAQELFGKASMELLPLLARGREEIEKSLKDADRYGQVLSESTIKALDNAGDAWNAAGKSAQVFGAEITNIISGPLTSLSHKLAEGATAIRRFFKPDEISKEDAAQERLTNITNQIKEVKTQLDLAKSSGQQFIASMASGKFEQIKVSDIKTKLAALEDQKKALEESIAPKPVDDSIKGSSSKNPLSFADKFAGKLPSQLNISYAIDQQKEEQKTEQDKQLKSKKEYLKKLDDIEQQGLADLSARSDESIRIMQEGFEKRRQMQQDSVYLGEQIGQAFADGITKSNGGLKEALKGTIQVFLSFLEKRLIISITENTFKRFGEMSFPGLLVAAGEAAAITGAFELAKSKIGNMASGGSVRQSGYYRVGEQGPEDVFMLRGSQVMNAIQTKNISNATTNSVTVNVLGSNGRVVETLRASLRSGSGDSFVRDLKQALAVA